MDQPGTLKKKKSLKFLYFMDRPRPLTDLRQPKISIVTQKQKPLKIT